MNKILVLIEKDCLLFSKYTREISEENLNNTNVINIKNLKFTEEYIAENLEIITTFFNLIALKYNITSAVIKNLDIALTSIKILNQLNSIKSVKFTEDKDLSFAISLELFNNKKLEHIECYNLPDIMFYRFDKGVVKTRSKILSTSNFFNYNNIKTHSDLYDKDKIIIDKLLDLSDIDDILYFFNINKNLRKIYLKRYSLINVQFFINIINEKKLKKVSIIIFEDDTTTNDILNDIKKLNELSKKYNINIKIKYSKEYKQKNVFKELNLTFIKIIILTIVVMALIILVCIDRLNNKDVKIIQKNLSDIEDVLEEKIETLEFDSQDDSDSNEENEENSNSEVESQEKKSNYVSPYYKQYSKIYDDLLEINSDTVGWLSVNNTKVNYPVVQAADNEYYLNHSYDKKYNMLGWVYADHRNDFDNLDKNTIIYGHGMINGGLMFTTLTNVLNKSWYQNSNNLIIKFSIKNVEYEWKIFSIYTIAKTNDYLYTNFDTDDKYLEFLNMIKDRSIYNFEVPVDANDNIVTLSTCYRNENNRLVIHAKKIQINLDDRW